jgi:biofilm PGA synthesis N-glycosyltransferase PgaC
VWEFLRAIYQMTKKPLVLGGLLLAAGYMWALLRRVERPMSGEVREFRRREQMQRLKKFLTQKWSSPGRDIQLS